MDIKEMITNAKNLSNKLKEKEVIADNLISRADDVNKHLRLMQEYSECVEKLNTAVGQRPHAEFVKSIQEETRHLRELQQENREMRAALEDHHKVLELVMSKYRKHISQLTALSESTNDLQLAQMKNNELEEIVHMQSEKIQEMAAVMQTAAQISETEEVNLETEITRLYKENDGLREILKISNKINNNSIKNDNTAH